MTVINNDKNRLIHEITEVLAPFSSHREAPVHAVVLPDKYVTATQRPAFLYLTAVSRQSCVLMYVAISHQCDASPTCVGDHVGSGQWWQSPFVCTTAAVPNAAGQHYQIILAMSTKMQKWIAVVSEATRPK